MRYFGACWSTMEYHSLAVKIKEAKTPKKEKSKRFFEFAKELFIIFHTFGCREFKESPRKYLFFLVFVCWAIMKRAGEKGKKKEPGKEIPFLSFTPSASPPEKIEPIFPKSNPKLG